MYVHHLICQTICQQGGPEACKASPKNNSWQNWGLILQRMIISLHTHPILTTVHLCYLLPPITLQLPTQKKAQTPKHVAQLSHCHIYYSRKVSLNKCLFRGSKQISFLNTTVCSPAGHFTKIRSHI